MPSVDEYLNMHEQQLVTLECEMHHVSVLLDAPCVMSHVMRYGMRHVSCHVMCYGSLLWYVSCFSGIRYSILPCCFCWNVTIFKCKINIILKYFMSHEEYLSKYLFHCVITSTMRCACWTKGFKSILLIVWKLFWHFPCAIVTCKVISWSCCGTGY